ncbi:hypothetical protein [Mycolicibacterium peregrinum]|uniref:hypothetical protein n=1 Tax=Mycolicibacterium peregrinum TaxID=43304 RepID=UPI003AAD9908
MSDTVPSGMVNKTPSEVCQVAADYWASKAMACEESARLSIEQAERQEHEAAIYRHTEQQWRDSKAAIDAPVRGRGRRGRQRHGRCGGFR